MSNKKSTKKSVKSEQPKAKASVKVPSFKALIKSIVAGDKPRGLKVAKNDAGGYTFSYGPKSAPVAVIASADEIVSVGLAAYGLKLS